MTATITLSPAVESLIEFLGEVRPGANIITFTARTAVKLNKKHRETKEPCPFKEVWKTSTVNAMIQCNYGAAMERRTDEPYVPGETWHEPVLDSKGRLTPCSRDPKTDKFYLRVQDPETIKSAYIADGVPVEFAALKPYLSPPKAYKEGDHIRWNKVVYIVAHVYAETLLVTTTEGVPVATEIPIREVKPVVGFCTYGLQGIEEIKVDGRVWTKPLFTFEAPE